MASGLIICFIFRPIFLDRTNVGSKHSSVKCSLHRAECSLGPLHLSFVLCMYLQCPSSSKLAIYWKLEEDTLLILRIIIIEHANAT